MELRKKLISVAALAFTVALGAGMACMSASAEEAKTLEDFAITEFSVRVNASKTEDGKDTSGLRFKTVTPEGKDAYDAYYTILSIEGKGSTKVWADTWRPTNDGWNTVVMGIPQSDYQTDITATSYVEVDGEVFATAAATLNLSDAAFLALPTAKTQADAIAINKYIWTEGASVSKTYTMSDYTAGTQYADNEEHVLDEVVAVTTTDCHFTTQLRIYASTTYNGFAIIQAAQPIKGLTVNAGYKEDTLNVYGSDDGATWSSDPVATISVTSSYKDYTVDFGGSSYKYLKLDVAGENQVRIASFGLDMGAGGGYGLGEVPLVLPEDGSELTIEDVLLFPLTETTTQKYYLTAQVKSVYQSSGKDCLTLVDDANKTLTAYNVDYTTFAVQPAIGDTVTLYGALGVYSGNNQMVQPEIEEVIVCDKNKAQAVLDQLTFAEEDLATLESGTRTFDLPVAEADYDFDVEWTAGDNARIDNVNGKVTISAPEGQSGVAKFSVSVKVGDVTLSDSFTVQVGKSQGGTISVLIADYADDNGWKDGTKYTTLTMDANVTVTVSGNSNTGKYYVNGENWRIYQNESPSIVVSASGKTIVSVKITYTINNTGVLTLNKTNITSDTVVDVNAVSITFGVGNTGSATNGQVRITRIEVTYVG